MIFHSYVGLPVGNLKIHVQESVQKRVNKNMLKTCSPPPISWWPWFKTQTFTNRYRCQLSRHKSAINLEILHFCW